MQQAHGSAALWEKNRNGSKNVYISPTTIISFSVARIYLLYQEYLLFLVHFTSVGYAGSVVYFFIDIPMLIIP